MCYFLMAEIDGVIVRIGHNNKDEGRAIGSALHFLQAGHCGKSIRYVEVWQRHIDGNQMAWSSMLADI